MNDQNTYQKSGPGVSIEAMKKFHQHRLLVAGSKVSQDFEQINEYQRYVLLQISYGDQKTWCSEVKALQKTIQDEAFVGLGAVIINGVTVGRRAVVGAARG